MENQKIVVSVRCLPELKNDLIKDAKAVGITVSEFCENILSNKNQVLLNQEASAKEIINLKKQNGMQRDENAKLRKHKDEQDALSALLQNERLLQLFESLKNKNDLIDTGNGKILKVTYHQPIDVLTAMIYSYKL
jgi:hypothetical protein